MIMECTFPYPYSIFHMNVPSNLTLAIPLHPFTTRFSIDIIGSMKLLVLLDMYVEV